MEALALGAAFLSGVGPMRLGVLGLALYAPLTLVPVVALLIVRERKRFDDRGAVFCDAVAAELRSGSILDSALSTAAMSVHIAPGVAGSTTPPNPMDIAADVARELPGIATELTATVAAAARSGGTTADLFDELASLAIAQSEIAHEVRVAAAPARATAWFFVLAPGGFVALRGASGGLAGTLATPGQRLTALVGTALFAAGLAIVGAMMWRAAR